MRIKAKQPQLTNSLRFIKDAIKFGIDGFSIHSMHYVDLQVIVLTFQIESLNKILYELRQQQLHKKGIAKIEEATEADFNSL